MTKLLHLFNLSTTPKVDVSSCIARQSSCAVKYDAENQLGILTEGTLFGGDRTCIYLPLGKLVILDTFTNCSECYIIFKGDVTDTVF